MWRRPAYQTLSKGLDILSATARVAPDLLKAPAILSDTTVSRSAVDREDLKPYWKSEQRPHFSSPVSLLTSHRKKTNRAVFFSCRPFPKILKNRDHRQNLPTDTYWRVQLVCKKFQADSSLEPPPEYSHDQMPLTNQGSLWPF